VKIYNTARGSPTPALNALATIMLISSLFAIALGFFVYRRLTRGERTQESTVEGFAAQI
jgi:spermidine/putrescine transport system permease protein